MYSYMQTRLQSGETSRKDYSGTDPKTYNRNPLRINIPSNGAGGEMHHIIPLNIASNYRYFNRVNINQPWNLIRLHGELPNNNLVVGAAPQVFHRDAGKPCHSTYDRLVRNRLANVTDLRGAQAAAGVIKGQILAFQYSGKCLDNSGIG